MPFRRQAHLGPTDFKTLTIVEFIPPPQGSSNERDRTSLIFQLPDELLVAIVEFAASEPGARSRKQHRTFCNNETLLILSRVCQRLRRLAQPLLYRDICVLNQVADFASVVPPSIPVIKLHRTLRNRADLRQHCRSLYVRISNGGLSHRDEYAYSIAEDLADWLTNTRRLTVDGGFSDEPPGDTRLKELTCTLIRRMTANFANLGHLNITRYSGGTNSSSVFKWLDCPRLKTLEMQGVFEVNENDESVELAPEKLRTAPFTALHLFTYAGTAHVASLLIKWPKVLTSFTFTKHYNPQFMDYSMFETWLLIHADTLTSIDIGFLSGSSRLLNARLFPALEFLRLSRWQLPVPLLAFSEEDANVLGPRLKTFCWDLNIYDQHNGWWLDFGEAEEKWVESLAERAVKRKAVLERIEIEFRPDDYWGTKEEMGYPWDRMDRVRDEVCRPNGMDLVYSEPLVKRDAWLKYVRSGSSDSVGDDASVDHTAEDEHSSVADEEDEAEMLDTELQWAAYQGENIRKYFN